MMDTLSTLVPVENGPSRLGRAKTVKPLHTDGNELYWDIWRKLQVRQCVKISCFISCFSTIMTCKFNNYMEGSGSATIK